MANRYRFLVCRLQTQIIMNSTKVSSKFHLEVTSMDVREELDTKAPKETELIQVRNTEQGSYTF